MKKSIFNSAVKIAKSKLHKHPEAHCYAHYSFIVQNNKIVEWATNCAHIPPKHYGYHRNNDMTFIPKFHSEVFSYKKAKGLLEDDCFEIINIRLTRNGEVKLSKPCNCCLKLLRSLGCKKFYYSSEYGFLSLN